MKPTHSATQPGHSATQPGHTATNPTHSDIKPSHLRGAIVVVIAVGLVLRVWSMLADVADQPGEYFYAAHDDGFTITAATADSWAECARICAEDVHPPLYFFLMRALMLPLPDDLSLDALLLIARSVSLCMSIGSMLLLFLIARRLLGDERIALAALAVYALAPHNVFWAHMARNHQMLTFVGSLGWWLLLRWLDERRRWDFALYVATMVVVAQTNYLGAMVIASHGVFTLYRALTAPNRSWARFRRETLPVWIVLPLAGLTLAPWVGVIQSQYAGDIIRRVNEEPISVVTPLFVAVFGTWHFYSPRYWPTPLFLAQLGMFLAAIVFVARQAKVSERARDLLVWAFVPPALTLGLDAITGACLAIRHLDFCNPAGVALFAYGIGLGIERFRRARASDEVASE